MKHCSNLFASRLCKNKIAPFIFRKFSALLLGKTSQDQRNVSIVMVYCWGSFKSSEILVMILTQDLLSIAVMEAWWLDLPKKTNKPDKAPFAHLIIDGNKIPSGKFLLNHIFLIQKWGEVFLLI